MDPQPGVTSTASRADAPSGPPGDGGAGRPGHDGRRRRRWPAIVATAALVAVAILVTALAIIKVPYVIISPGDATALDDSVVSISGTETYPHDGELLYLTVRVTNDDPNVWRYLFSQLDDDLDVQKREAVIGCASYEDSGRLNDELMIQSQDVAKEVALTRLGYAVELLGTRTIIRDVECGGPSEGKLRPGDMVTAVDGMPVSTAEEIAPLVQAHDPGDIARISVERDGEPVEVSVRLGDREGTAYAGVISQTLYDWSFPVDVEIDTARVSGPSAGLAFALAIVDDLSPGDLTGGRKVAITGSIEADGRVGPVGGVAQKAVTARDAGATLMLVPFGEGKQAREHAGDMKVVVVRTLDDALRALEAAGGDPVPPPPTPAATGEPDGTGQ
jgi:PDZ domain-containing protein